MKKETTIWFEQAEEHYEDMLYNYKGGRYSLTVYCCHQVLEKIIKAAIVEFAHKVPPKSHALEYLIRQTKLIIPNKKWYTDLAETTRHFWRVRYDDFRKYKYTTKEKVEPTVNITKEIYLWIKKQLKNT